MVRTATTNSKAVKQDNQYGTHNLSSVWNFLPFFLKKSKLSVLPPAHTPCLRANFVSILKVRSY